MAKNTRFKLPAAAYLIIIENDSVLLIKRKGSWRAGFWSLIAGHIDGNETMKEAIAREAFEEAGIVVRPDQLEVTCVMHRKADDTEYFDVFLRAKTWSGNLEIREPDKIEEMGFFPLDSLPEKTLDYVERALRLNGSGISYIDHGW